MPGDALLMCIYDDDADRLLIWMLCDDAGRVKKTN